VKDREKSLHCRCFENLKFPTLHFVIAQVEIHACSYAKDCIYLDRVQDKNYEWERNPAFSTLKYSAD